uniref:Probable succinyl-diaminopimelate desuccinylase n=1 Tax=uncultured marine thaumarchaeote KM3_54_F04 TaxID=1456191 RepID=A0A075HDW3_9ARCH|nr:acetylornithine deacetylase or succinyl-diaminopimelate desuccinylase (dapE) [uncultured marine thaumarchaeote KM3_54_F04]
MDIKSKIKEEDITNLAQKLIRIPSDEIVGEQEVCEYLSDILKSLGMKVRLQEVLPKRPNIIAEVLGGNNGKSIMFNGHIDTVPIGNIEKWNTDPYKAIIKDNKLFGRGATDMKGSIASMIIAIKYIMNNVEDFNGKIIFTGVMAEETTGLGTQKVLEENIKTDMAIVGEPSDEKIYRAHKGTLWFNIFTYGKLEHSSESDTKSNNAIINMMKLIEEINKISKELEGKNNSLVGHPSINVGLIEGGTKQNMIADSCKVSIDRRILPEEEPNEILDELRVRFDNLRLIDNRLKFNIEKDTIREAVEVSESEPIVQEVKRAVNKILNINPIVSGMKATTDMSILVNQGNIPSVIYGPGFIKQAHTIDEFIEVERLVESSQVYAEVLLNILTNN